MTDEQLKAAAIALCEIRGLDPFCWVEKSEWQEISPLAKIHIDKVNIAGFCVTETPMCERWATLTPKIKEHEEIREAVIRAIAGNGWSK